MTDAKFASFGDFLAAVLLDMQGEQRDQDHHKRDPRLVFSAAALGQSEGVGSAGGYLVPAEYASALWIRVNGVGQIIARCARQTITKGNLLIVPAVAEGASDSGSRFGGVKMAWTDEADQDSASEIEIVEINLKLKKLLGLVYASDELLDDAPALAAVIDRMFGLEASFAIEDAIVNGNGVNKPLGVLHSDALIVIDKESGQPDGSITAANLAEMAARLWGPSHDSALWLMSNDAYAAICELEDSDGVVLFETGPDGSRLLHQMPVLLCEYTPTLGEQGDVMLCDFSQYLLAEKSSEILSSIHVQFITDETAVKLRYRVDGAPAWAEPIKPKNSSLMQSPFIALGARAA